MQQLFQNRIISAIILVFASVGVLFLILMGTGDIQIGGNMQELHAYDQLKIEADEISDHLKLVKSPKHLYALEHELAQLKSMYDAQKEKMKASEQVELNDYLGILENKIEELKEAELITKRIPHFLAGIDFDVKEAERYSRIKRLSPDMANNLPAFTRLCRAIQMANECIRDMGKERNSQKAKGYGLRLRGVLNDKDSFTFLNKVQRKEIQLYRDVLLAIGSHPNWTSKEDIITFSLNKGIERQTEITAFLENRKNKLN